MSDGETLELKAVVTAENGNTAEYTLKIKRPNDPNAYIQGKILTENIYGEYVSKVTVYRIEEKQIENEAGEMENVLEKVKYKEVETEDDGTFIITIYEKGADSEEVLNYKYELVVTKLGYLDYGVTNIIIESTKTCDIGEYMLIAGDTNQNGYINIDDLVSTNNNFGKNNSISDFNEDGVVNVLDRNILKKNYGKREKLEEYKMGE